MLPKDYPVQTTENDWRLRKKLEKMMNDLPPKTPLGKRLELHWGIFTLNQRI